jgi:hypothetical protein
VGGTHVIQHRDGIRNVAELDVIGLGAPEPARVISDHAVALGEHRYVAIPLAQVREAAVDQEERMSASLDLVVDLAAVDRHEARCAHRRHPICDRSDTFTRDTPDHDHLITT